jgi:hypothetical protein
MATIKDFKKRRPELMDQDVGRCFWDRQSFEKLLGDVAEELEP